MFEGCQTFQEFFDRHPEVLSHFDKFDAIEIDAVRVSDALRMHASRVLAIVEDIVDNTGNPDKIRKLMQDLGRNHYKQVCHSGNGFKTSKCNYNILFYTTLFIFFLLFHRESHKSI